MSADFIADERAVGAVRDIVGDRAERVFRNHDAIIVRGHDMRGTHTAAIDLNQHGYDVRRLNNCTLEVHERAATEVR